jgi:flagellar hook-associated protein 2
MQKNPAEVQKLLEGWATKMDSYLQQTTEVSTVPGLAGTFYNRINSLEEQITDTNSEITDWNTKLAAEEDQLRTQFSNMEEALQQLQTTSSYITSQLAALSSSSSSSSSTKSSSFSSSS